VPFVQGKRGVTEQFKNFRGGKSLVRDKWVPVTTTWCVLRLRMEERPPIWRGSCEYIE